MPDEDKTLSGSLALMTSREERLGRRKLLNPSQKCNLITVYLVPIAPRFFVVTSEFSLVVDVIAKTILSLGSINNNPIIK